MTIKKTLAAVAICASAVTATTAVAQQNEFLGILNATGDTQFGQFSYRRALSGDLSSGVILRFDVSRGAFDVVGGSGNIDTIRLMAGYRMPVADNVQLTFYAGGSYRQREFSGCCAASEFEETGGFASLEINADIAGNSNAFGVVEYDSTTDLVYAGAYYLFGLGNNFQMGPSINVLEEDGYSRTAAGLRVTYDLGGTLDFSASAMWGESNSGGPDEDASYLEVQIRTEF